MYAQLVL
jgi:SNF2 family DNA or RNA helicase